MTNRQIAQVGIGFIGVWTLVTAVEMFASMVMAQGGQFEGAAILVVFVPLVLLLGLSYVLVFRSASIAAAITPDASGPSAQSSTDLTRVLLPVVGVLLLGQAIPSFANTALNFILFSQFEDQPAAQPLMRHMISTGIEIVFAVYIIARPERLLAFLQRRPAGADGMATITAP